MYVFVSVDKDTGHMLEDSNGDIVVHLTEKKASIYAMERDCVTQALHVQDLLRTYEKAKELRTYLRSRKFAYPDDYVRVNDVLLRI